MSKVRQCTFCHTYIEGPDEQVIFICSKCAKIHKHNLIDSVELIKRLTEKADDLANRAFSEGKGLFTVEMNGRELGLRFAIIEVERMQKEREE
jgi:ribosomal protein L24E